jgi:hypothetical protein
MECLNKIVAKIDKNPDLYIKIKEMFADRPNWNDSNRFGNVGNGPTKNIYFLLQSAITKNAPKYIKRSDKAGLWDLKT